MPTAQNHLIVIAGGPGSGKTTLTSCLRDRGFAVTTEAGRAIIRDQLAIGGEALPWRNSALFAEFLLQWEIRSYRWASQRTGSVFFDQALPGLPGYLRLLGREVPLHFEAAVAAFPYHHQVFVAPPWREVYRTDSERRQSFDHAHREYDAIVDSYARYGYDLLELPRSDVSERVSFVLHHLGDTTPNRDCGVRYQAESAGIRFAETGLLGEP